jgi:hypothetical protein
MRTPKTNSGTSSTTGGTTISETSSPSRVSRPGKLQRAKPQPARVASASVSATAELVKITLFRNQVENWSLRAASKPASVG